jgi:hypothetical protein
MKEKTMLREKMRVWTAKSLVILSERREEGIRWGWGGCHALGGRGRLCVRRAGAFVTFVSVDVYCTYFFFLVYCLNVTCPSDISCRVIFHVVHQQ